MGKDGVMRKVKEIFLKILVNALLILIYMSLLVIYLLHKTVHFFPDLFLFDFCFLIGYPLFLRYVLKKKWFECTKDDYLCIRYIMLPLLFMELAFLLCYPHETIMAIDFLAESEFLN